MMTCRKNPGREVAPRDIIQLVIHLSSTLWAAAFWMKFTYDWDEDVDKPLCTWSVLSIHFMQLTQIFSTLLVWYIRLRTLIGPVYPHWVQYPTVFLITGIPILFIIDASTVSSGFKEVSSIGTVCYYSGPLSEFVLVSKVLLVVPALVYLIMFLAPLIHHRYIQTSDFFDLILRHIMITMFDITINIAVVIAYETFDEDRYGLHILLSIINVGIFVSNLLIIFVFADWRERLLYGLCSFSFGWISVSNIEEIVKPQAQRLKTAEFTVSWEKSLFVDDFKTFLSSQFDLSNSRLVSNIDLGSMSTVGDDGGSLVVKQVGCTIVF